MLILPHVQKSEKEAERELVEPRSRSYDPVISHSAAFLLLLFGETANLASKQLIFFTC